MNSSVMHSTFAILFDDVSVLFVLVLLSSEVVSSFFLPFFVVVLFNDTTNAVGPG